MEKKQQWNQYLGLKKAHYPSSQSWMILKRRCKLYLTRGFPKMELILASTLCRILQQHQLQKTICWRLFLCQIIRQRSLISQNSLLQRRKLNQLLLKIMLNNNPNSLKKKRRKRMFMNWVFSIIRKIIFQNGINR